jgi:hypothetical protein
MIRCPEIEERTASAQARRSKSMRSEPMIAASFWALPRAVGLLLIATGRPCQA